MTDLLTSVYFTEYCNACGQTYPVTLYEILKEQRLDEEWERARPCEVCDRQRSRLVDAVPQRELAEFAHAAGEFGGADAPSAGSAGTDALRQAWLALAAALEARSLQTQAEPAFLELVARS